MNDLPQKSIRLNQGCTQQMKPQVGLRMHAHPNVAKQALVGRVPLQAQVNAVRHAHCAPHLGCALSTLCQAVELGQQGGLATLALLNLCVCAYAAWVGHSVLGCGVCLAHHGLSAYAEVLSGGHNCEI